MSERRHLHPAGLLMVVVDSLAELILPVLVAVLLGAGMTGPDAALLLGALGVAGAVAVGVVRWLATVYAVSAEGIRLRKGLLFHGETFVPASRVAAVDTVQNPLQRVLGVVELQVHTAGGGGAPELSLRAVSRGQARRIAAALGHPHADAEAGHDRAPTWRLSPGRLLVAALTAPQVGVLVPIIGGAGALAQNVLDAETGRGLLRNAPDSPAEIALAVGAVALVAWLLSILGAVVAFWSFTVTIDGDRLRIRRGLGQRKAVSVPLGTIHAITLVESPLRQPFGLVTVRMETAGYRSGPVATRTLLPLVRLDEAPRLLARLVPELAARATELPPPIGRGAWRRPPGRALRRYLLTPAAIAAAPGAALVALVPAAWPAAVAAVVLGMGAGAVRYHDAAWRRTARRVIVRERRLARTTLVALASRLQDYTVTSTPLQRRSGLADVRVTVGSGRRARVRHLEADDADVFFLRLRPANLRRRRRRSAGAAGARGPATA